MTLGLTVRNGHKHHVNHMTTCSFPPPKTSQLQATSHIPGLDEVKRAIVLRDMRGSQSEPLPALLFLGSSHSDDRLAQLFWGVQYLFVETKSPFLLSTSSCFCRRWTCDWRWDKRKHNATTRRRVHIHSGCRPHWPALRGKLRLPHPKPLTSSTLQTCPLGKWWCVFANNCHKARRGRAAPTTARRRSDRAPE